MSLCRRAQILQPIMWIYAFSTSQTYSIHFSLLFALAHGARQMNALMCERVRLSTWKPSGAAPKTLLFTRAEVILAKMMAMLRKLNAGGTDAHSKRARASVCVPGAYDKRSPTDHTLTASRNQCSGRRIPYENHFLPFMFDAFKWKQRMNVFGSGHETNLWSFSTSVITLMRRRQHTNEYECVRLNSYRYSSSDLSTRNRIK